MIRIYHISAIVWGLWTISPAAAAPLCPAMPDGLFCKAGSSGLAIAETADDAMRFAAAIDESARLFQAHFSRPAPSLALIAAPERFVALKDQLQTDLAMPWLARHASFSRAIGDALRETLRKSMPDLTPAAIEAEIDKKLAEIGGAQNREEGVIAHEACHTRFIKAYAFSSAESGGAQSHYGGSAPDWLDETAAILCEDAKTTADRRRQFALQRQGKFQGRIWPMRHFLEMAHPLAQEDAHLLTEAKKEAAAEGRSDGAFKITIYKGDEAKALIGNSNAPSFYLQARVFADFLIETTKTENVFGSIAEGYAAGRTFNDWLAENGAANGLPTDIAAFEAKWEAYLTHHYPIG